MLKNIKLSQPQMHASFTQKIKTKSKGSLQESIHILINTKERVSKY
jgi:hypothetical protein